MTYSKFLTDIRPSTLESIKLEDTLCLEFISLKSKTTNMTNACKFRLMHIHVLKTGRELTRNDFSLLSLLYPNFFDAPRFEGINDV